MTLPRTSTELDIQAVITELVQELQAEVSRVGQSNRGVSTVVRVERVVQGLSPLQVIRSARAERKFYWRERDGSMEIAGLGVADIIAVDGVSSAERAFQQIRTRLGSTNATARYFGGFCFDRFERAKPVSAEWQSFGRGFFMLPLVEISRQGEKTKIAVQVLLDDPLATKTIEQLHFDSDDFSESTGELARVCGCRELPVREDWDRRVSRALRSIQSGEIRKVVLARRVSFECAKPVDMFALVGQAFRTDDSATVFAFQQEPRVGFAGGSPELLFRREADNVVSEAIAGTRRITRENPTDEHSSIELQQSQKDLREVELVREAILDGLGAFCTTVTTTNEPEIHRAGNVQHLRYLIAGVVKSGASDADLLSALSPTPAVCGTPSEHAIELIRELEPFDRGWYAGPVGWISHDAAEFAVAIRSALVDGNTVHLYSGAGIVEGSEAGSEWDELDAKIATLKAALGA